MNTTDRGAHLSVCGRYRYVLWRCWDTSLPRVMFVMLNPSTADAIDDDPTIRRCVGFARSWGMGSVWVCNLYPWRATNPRDLPSGPEVHGEVASGLYVNDIFIKDTATRSTKIIVAWGTKIGPCETQPKHVMDLLEFRQVETLGLSKTGQPLHPLFRPGDTIPMRYHRFGIPPRHRRFEKS
jgi:hypothetical protein